MTDQPNFPHDEPQADPQAEAFTAPSEPQAESTSTRTPFSAFLEHQSNAAQETLQAFQALLPPDFRVHSAAARHELMLSFKVLVDGATEAIETELKRARDAAAKAANSTPGSGSDAGSDRPSTTGKSKVKVEVL